VEVTLGGNAFHARALRLEMRGRQVKTMQRVAGTTTSVLEAETKSPDSWNRQVADRLAQRGGVRSLSFATLHIHNQSISLISLIATLRPESRIANDMQLK